MIKLLRVAAVCISLLPLGAEACTCFGWRLPEEEKIRNAFEKSEHVVLARVTSFAESEPSVEGIVRVTGAFESVEEFKGPALPMIPMYDEYRKDAFASSCGEGLPDLSVGDVALLYLREPEVGEWTFSYCSRSRVLQAPEDDPEVKQLRGMRVRADG